MPRIDVIKTIENVVLNEHYQLWTDQIPTIIEYSGFTEMAVINAFKFGYAQGTKATKRNLHTKPIRAISVQTP